MSDLERGRSRSFYFDGMGVMPRVAPVPAVPAMPLQGRIMRITM
jgi:hypothetical protein